MALARLGYPQSRWRHRRLGAEPDRDVLAQNWVIDQLFRLAV
jgi:hypothetical protein